MHLGIVRFKYTLFGGAERLIERLISQQARSGGIKQVSIFSSEWSKQDSLELTKLRDLNIRLNFVNIACSRAGRFLRHRDFLRKASIAIQEAESLDVIQSHERLPGCDIFRAGDGVHAAWLERLAAQRGWIAGKALRADPFHRLLCQAERGMANDPRIVFVANSPLCRQELQSYLGVPDRRIALIPNSINLSSWRRISPDAASKYASRKSLGLAPDKPTVLFVGSGFERKGLRPLIEAVGLLTDVQLLVVGKDKSIARYQRYADMRAKGRVKFSGPIPETRMAYAAADIFALPSLYDSFSNAALEALASGLPCILTRDVGLASFPESSEAVALCSRDPDSIREALEHCLKNLNTMSLAAEASARSFSDDRIFHLWRDLYAKVTEAKAAR